MQNLSAHYFQKFLYVFSFLTIPVTEMFNSSCPEIIIAIFLSKTNIKNLIRSCLFLINHVCRIYTPYLNIVVITIINCYKEFFVWRYGTCSNSSSFFCKFNSLNLLTSSSVPNKNSWSLSLLSWNSICFITASINFWTSNIVCMSIKITRNLLTLIINFANSKKGLRI